jgi:hypothetical protein
MKKNMQTLENVIAEARSLAGDGLAPDPFARARQAQPAIIADALEHSGFPVTATGKAKLSLVPLLFQEANYDDIAWMRQRDGLRQLSRNFALDCLVQSGGQERPEASAAEFAAYVEAARGAIHRRKRR